MLGDFKSWVGHSPEQSSKSLKLFSRVEGWTGDLKGKAGGCKGIVWPFGTDLHGGQPCYMRYMRLENGPWLGEDFPDGLSPGLGSQAHSSQSAELGKSGADILRLSSGCLN